MNTNKTSNDLFNIHIVLGQECPHACVGCYQSHTNDLDLITKVYSSNYPLDDEDGLLNTTDSEKLTELIGSGIGARTQEQKDKEKQSDKDIQVVANQVRKIIEDHPDRYFQVTFFGGESLLYSYEIQQLIVKFVVKTSEYDYNTFGRIHKYNIPTSGFLFKVNDLKSYKRNKDNLIHILSDLEQDFLGIYEHLLMVEEDFLCENPDICYSKSGKLDSQKYLEWLEEVKPQINLSISFDGQDNDKLRNINSGYVIKLFKDLTEQFKSCQHINIQQEISCVVPRNRISNLYVSQKIINDAFSKDGVAYPTFTLPHVIQNKKEFEIVEHNINKYFDDLWVSLKCGSKFEFGQMPKDIFQEPIRKNIRGMLIKNTIVRQDANLSDADSAEYNDFSTGFDWCQKGVNHKVITKHPTTKEICILDCEYSSDNKHNLSYFKTLLDCDNCEAKNICKKPCLKNCELTNEQLNYSCEIRRLLASKINCFGKDLDKKYVDMFNYKELVYNEMERISNWQLVKNNTKGKDK